MSNKPIKTDEKKKSNSEKPVSLAGASFKDVLADLLKPPKPKEKRARQ